MKRFFLCASLVAALFMVGCSSSPKWDKDEIEQKIQANYNNQPGLKELGATCTEVQIVADGENKFTGFAKFSDGSQKDITVTVDPNTGEFIF